MHKQGLNVLRKCGIPDWVWSDSSEWSGFIEFFTNNITEDNILTDEEMLEYVLL